MWVHENPVIEDFSLDILGDLHVTKRLLQNLAIRDLAQLVRCCRSTVWQLVSHLAEACKYAACSDHSYDTLRGRETAEEAMPRPVETRGGLWLEPRNAAYLLAPFYEFDSHLLLGHSGFVEGELCGTE